MIRKFKPADTDQVMQIWLQGNRDAHSFVSEQYWQLNFKVVRREL